MQYGHFWNKVCTKLARHKEQTGEDTRVHPDRVRALHEAGCTVDEATAIVQDENRQGMDEEEGYLDDQGWLCQCGYWQEDGFHCSECGREPPWGCDCEFCMREEDDF